ncbi:MAG: FAD-dependent oxidoreductase [Acidobacteriota bacterium]
MPASRRRRPSHLAPLSRRQVLALGGASAATLLLTRCAGLSGRPSRSGGAPLNLPYGPIDRTLGEVAPTTFSGEEPEPAHRLLWDRESFLGSAPPAGDPEQVPLVIVGGGIAGLTTAWLLRAHRPVLLERAPRFGGASRGESWRGIDYATGAAYFIRPEERTPIARFLEELDLSPRIKTEEDPVVLGGRRFDHFWEGASTPAGAAQIRRLGRYFQAVLEEEEGQLFPDIPVTDSARRAHVDDLDRRSFLDHLQGVAGGPLHPHAAAVIEHYCWSSLGASMAEVSAAAGLNFYASEFGEVCVLPGGNAAVAERLVDRLATGLPPGHLRPGCLAVDVQVVDEGVRIRYADQQGRLHTLLARAAVLACPKFVAGKILREAEASRLAAIARLRYRAYLVANVLLGRSVRHDFYDLFLAGEGTAPYADLEAAAARQGATDVVLGTWARPQRERTVLTLYRPLPFDGGRAAVYDEDSHAGYRAQFAAQLEREILPLVGARPADVVDLRLARWGHPLPVAEVGLIADGVPEALGAPFRGRVFFAQQDTWALPAFETAVTEALLTAPRVARVLEGG